MHVNIQEFNEMIYNTEKRLAEFIDHLSRKNFNWNLMNKDERKTFLDEGQAAILYSICYAVFIYDIPSKKIVEDLEISEKLYLHLITLLKKEAITLKSIIDDHLKEININLPEDEEFLVIKGVIDWGFDYVMANYAP